MFEDSLSDQLFAMLSRKIVLRVLLQDDDGPVVCLHLTVILLRLKLYEQTTQSIDNTVHELCHFRKILQYGKVL